MKNDRTIIIAEAGVNHNGDINLAKKLIDVAADANADYVKFQTFKAKNLVTKSAKKATYQIGLNNLEESQYNMLKKLEISEQDFENILKHCEYRKIAFLSTAFDIEGIDFLCRLGIDKIKIPSGEITNFPLLKHIGKLGKPVIISTGMATMEEVIQAIETIENYGTKRKNMTVLHCNTDYPTDINDVNLRAMVTIRDRLNVNVGYSDHTLGLEVPIAAVSLGASVIEKHFTLDRNLPGPDHSASLEPNQLQEMIRSIREIEKALGDGVKRPMEKELKNKEIVRKSLVASSLIKKGEKFTPENMTTKRPGSGISPMLWNEVIGKTAKKDFNQDELIEL